MVRQNDDESDDYDETQIEIEFPTKSHLSMSDLGVEENWIVLGLSVIEDSTFISVGGRTPKNRMFRAYFKTPSLDFMVLRYTSYSYEKFSSAKNRLEYRMKNQINTDHVV